MPGVSGIAASRWTGLRSPMTKTQKIWLITATAVAVLAIFCCAATVAAAIWLFRDSPEDVVEDYLEAVQADNGGDAREYVCDSWRDGAFPNVTNALAKWTDMVDWDIIDSEIHDESARVTYQVLRVTDSGNMQFTLVREEGDWRVCGIRSSR
jgi:hypothetical protein